MLACSEVWTAYIYNDHSPRGYDRQSSTPRHISGIVAADGAHRAGVLPELLRLVVECALGRELPAPGGAVPRPGRVLPPGRRERPPAILSWRDRASRR